MPYDSAATRARLLDAAYQEFSKWGLAGARVDRIAAAASANKQAIYAYFGSKENLFDAVLGDRLKVLADTVPYTPDDLPGYAGALFDALSATPDLLRLTRWRGLERDDATPGEIESHLEKAVALRTALNLPDDRTAIDILEIVVAISMTWSTMAPGLRAVGGEDPEQRKAAHRAMAVAAVAAICESVAGKGQ
ncbi:TetR family transcriptional regulator [Kibdelosporangium aridum]|uniref:Transcriptional regulator, TetR family n=1 Tax=Kibdelosporangium aridum TaxID=2030 RepID=A0A1W2FW95_KIBAR|nr:TetR family transcriptional regulator [Kibdelosporangium aridum]SMD25896.1 transcriptional regulator, TetR family [Kibdelosporangium aridum]